MYTFDVVIAGLKEGKRYARYSWGPTGVFIFLVNGSEFTVNREPLLSILGEGTQGRYRAHIDQRRADGSICVWVPRADDLLEADWVEV